MQGRTAIVTGGSRGIGLAIGRELAAHGVRVTLVGRDQTTLDAAVAGMPDRLNAFAGDASDPAVAAACVAAVIAREGRLDILVNNAGGPPGPKALLDLAPDVFTDTLRFNLEGPLNWTREAWRAWMSEHGGAVLNIASIGGLTQPRLMGAYAVAKAGLLQMTRVLAAELGPRVRVNAIAPGIVRTDATAMVMDGAAAMAAGLPMERVGEVDDVAKAARFLVSDEASWITGDTLTIDGGTLVASGKLKRREKP